MVETCLNILICASSIPLQLVSLTFQRQNSFIGIKQAKDKGELKDGVTPELTRNREDQARDVKFIDAIRYNLPALIKQLLEEGEAKQLIDDKDFCEIKLQLVPHADEQTTTLPM